MYQWANPISWLCSRTKKKRELTVLILVGKRLELTRLCRRFWIKPWLQRRPMLSQHETLFPELERELKGKEIGPGIAVQMFSSLPLSLSLCDYTAVGLFTKHY